MSTVLLERGQGRTGHLACVCDPLAPEEAVRPESPAGAGSVALFALCSGFTIVAQAIVLTIVPIGGAILAPSGWASMIPFAALLIGATVATLPAAWLTGVDQRWGFALGSTFGIAGAAAAAWGMVAGMFGAFALGAFWLGLAQGFGAFYRHGAAAIRASDGRAIALVLGAGSLAALVTPSALAVARDVAGPLATAAALVMAAMAHLVATALAFALPRTRSLSARTGETQGEASVATFVRATAMGALAWAGMALMMGAGPSLMRDCGIGLSETTGVIAWHVLAMFAPALPAGYLITRGRAPIAGIVGLLSIVAGLASALVANTEWGFVGAMVLSGAGWSATTIAATTMVHADGAPSRARLAAHDFTLLAGALLGAAASALLH